MSNKLLRTVKRYTTVKKIVREKGNSITVFRKRIYGEWETGNYAKDTKGVYVIDVIYEIWDGEFYNYQQPIKPYETVERLALSLLKPNNN